MSKELTETLQIWIKRSVETDGTIQGTITFLLILSMLFLMQAKMRLAFLAIWEHC